MVSTAEQITKSPRSKVYLFWARTPLKPFIALYLLVSGGLLYLTLLSFNSPAQFQHALEAWDMHTDCLAGGVVPDCFYDITELDITYPYAHDALATFLNGVSKNEFQSGELLEGLVSKAQSIYHKTLFYIFDFTTLPFVVGWVVLGGYLVLYKRIADFPLKWLEGVVTGLGVSTLLYLVNHFLVRYQEIEVGRLVPTVELSNRVVFLCAIYLLIWFAPDAWYKRSENFLTKALLLVSTLAAFAIVPVSFDSKLILAPLFSFLLALGYFLWKRIGDSRKQLATLVYLTLAIGLIAAISKHWDFFTLRIFTDQHNRADLAEFINDFVIFLLGLLLTFLEFNKTASTTSSERSNLVTNISNVPVTVETPPQTKQNFVFAFLMGILFSVAIFQYFRNMLSTNQLNKD